MYRSNNLPNRIKLPCTLAFCAVLLGGCSLWEAKPEPPPKVELKPPTPPELYAEACGLERQRQHLEALKLFKSASDETLDQDLAAKADLGAARCLIHLGELKPALRALGELPAEPKSMLDRKRLAVAGEIFSRLGRPKDVEPALEVALANAETSADSELDWAPAAYANLGKAYLDNHKIHHALAMYYRAHELFELKGDKAAAVHCEAIAKALAQEMGARAPKPRNQP